MKNLIFVLFIMMMGMNVYAGAGMQRIDLTYEHSMRIPFRVIEIKLGSENRNARDYYIKVIAKHLRGVNTSNGEYTYDIEENIIPIEKEYFDRIYNELLELNFAEIVRESETYAVADGYTVTITFGPHSDITLFLRTPDHRAGMRQVTVIIEELFDKVGLLEWYR